MNDDLPGFDLLYTDIQNFMDQYTDENSIPTGLYDIFESDNGKQICMYVEHMEYIREICVKRLQAILVKHPNREIVFTVTCPELIGGWPAMGLYIRKNDISDGLLRQYFPPEYQSITYEGSRPGDRSDTIMSEDDHPEFKPVIRKTDGVFAAAAARRGVAPRWSFEVYDENPCGIALFTPAALMQPDVIAELQGVLRDFPNWVLLIFPDEMSDDEDRAMFLEAYHDEIVDRLDRSRLPPEYADLRYPGARLAKPMKSLDDY
jgi:hypothetical protein